MRLLEEGEAANLWQTGQSEKYTDGLYHSPTCPRLGRVSTGVQGAGSWCVGAGEQAWGENCCWLRGDRLGDGREEIHSRECLWRKTRHWKQGTTAESHTGGGATIVASVSPHVGTCR